MYVTVRVATFTEEENMNWKSVLRFFLPSEKMYQRDVKSYQSWWYILPAFALAAAFLLFMNWPKVVGDPLFGVILGLTAIVLIVFIQRVLIMIAWIFHKFAQRLES